uniref:Fe-S cluster binding protein n=1 Tax=uncultured Bacteroidota bacterium TaxID=152509 RepID=H5SK57_9BACT|nr:Fe-S cluster binding protein [uncultured Bacteroidetes bacterium]
MSLALTQAVKALAKGLGFPAFGVASAHPLTDTFTPTSLAYRRYLAWIAKGKHADMTYLAEGAALRGDPAHVLPGAQALLLTLASYFHSRTHRSPIAQYAWGADYHRVLRRKLQIIADYLVRKGYAARPFVDTAPLLEKAWAVEAGLGWIGKNTLLLNRKLGSYTFIGGVITTAPLVPDDPFVGDGCGTCQRCIEACPTQALQPYELDARRCIAYWTIEAPTLEGSPPLHGWIFGCDVCQQVCPWNRFAQPQGDFVPAAYAFLPRQRWATLSKAAVRRFQRGSALRRARPEKLLAAAQTPHPIKG